LGGRRHAAMLLCELCGAIQMHPKSARWQHFPDFPLFGRIMLHA
jgi:hypothetical protein